MTNNIYRFRVSIQDLPLPDFILHIFVQHDQPPKYLDLLDKIKLYSKSEITNLNDYYMVIEKDQIFKYKFKDDIGLQNAFSSITDQDVLEIKMIREVYHDNVPLVKPVFTKRPTSYTEEEDQMYLPSRKDSGISLEQEMEELKKEEPNKSRKLPALSHIITTELWNTSSLPSPPTPQHVSFYTKSPIKLPGLSSIIDPNHHNQYQQKQLAPIHAYHHPVRFDQKPLSPPLSASPRSPYHSQPLVTAKTKRSRTSSAHPSQFICEHIIDTITGKTCCQAFRRSYDLSRHQTIHLKNRPLCYCHDCGKKFTRLDALRRHERIQGHNNK
ncbi:hypothetical protein MFLAVUS_003549 [Mucor flavus]|uniref:C2H2-type domain-containing protein n=1 Tax=Mucor flavus TaxID=439312 RepID=A0ABP9YTG1_9FUNG